MKKFIARTLVLASMLIGMHVNVVMASIEQPISFLQYDTQWGDIPYTSCSNSRQTIRNSGCGPTAMAMVIHYYADKTITPPETSGNCTDAGTNDAALR